MLVLQSMLRLVLPQGNDDGCWLFLATRSDKVAVVIGGAAVAEDVRNEEDLCVRAKIL